MKNGGKRKKSRLPKKFFVALIVIVILYFAAVTVAATVLDQRHVRFYMTAPENMELECFHEYEEPGIYAVTTGGLFGETEKHLEVTTKSDLDNTKLGEYTINYSVHFWTRDYSTQRRVTVVDTTPPVIQLKHNEGYEPSWFTGYEEEGYTAIDNYDGDISAMVESHQEGDSMVYTVTDSSGNVATAVRENLFTYSEPEIQLYGEAEMYVNSSLSFTEPGYYAEDSLGDDLTEYVQVEGEVCPYQVGDYRIVYYIQNIAGETVSAERIVHVQPIKNPDTVSPEANTIYLTFDDGPGPYTEELLDVLAKYNVKATFFVTGANSKYFDLIAREYKEGHSVGVHSYSHNYKTIYASEEAYFKDFNQTEELIYSQTGSYTKLFRFPGGSSNTVSSFTPGIMTALTRDMTDMGYQYFDWNVSSGDAGETTKTDKVVSNIINGCTGRKVSVVLQHDIKDYSVAAVEQVIIWGLNNGYVFSALDVSSPAAHHGINN